MPRPGRPSPAYDPGAIRAVGLDLMDTLLADPYREAIVAATGLSLDQLEELCDGSGWYDLELGLIDDAEYGRRFFRPGCGHALDVPRLRRELDRGYRFADGMEELALELAARLPVHILSNYPHWYAGLRERFALDRFACGHHVSCEIGARKPDPEFLRRVLRRTGLAPRELLFVDDREVNVAAAREIGIPALRFAGAAGLRAALAPILGGARR